MRILVQRSLASSVLIDGAMVGKIEKGIVAFVGFKEGDRETDIDYLIDKLIHLRIFDDVNGVMNESLLDNHGNILSISQFTLYANTKKGRRPSYVEAMNPHDAEILYQLFNQKLEEQGITVETGVFGADMSVSITNDGPVTMMLESVINNV